MTAKNPAKSPDKKAATPRAELVMLEALHAKEKRLAARLRPPASATARDALRGLEVPAAMIALYTLHDGSTEPVFGPYQLLPVADVLEERSAMNALLGENPSWRTNGTWDPRWVPFMADGDGQLFVLDPAGSTEGGIAGQILFFDHEVGPTRELTSFDALLELMTTLAKKKLLGEDAWEARNEDVATLRAAARVVGLPKMDPQALAALLSTVDGDGDARLTPTEALALLRPAAARYSAEAALWERIAAAATALADWPLVVLASEKAMALEARRDKNVHVPALVAGLAGLGRDEDALAALRAGLGRITSANERRAGLVPFELSPRMRLCALRAVAELQPSDTETWELIARETGDAAERATAREKIITLVDATEYPNSFDVKRRLEALRAREHERIAAFAPDARLAALLEFAAVAKDGEWDVAWEDAARFAATLGRWDVVAAAAAKQIEHTYASLYEVCALRVRALFELGRANEALALVGEALALAYTGGDACFVAIPWQDERAAGQPVVAPPTVAAFQARAFALVTELSPDNFAAWKWRRVFAQGAERREVRAALVALCSEESARRNEDGEFYHSEEDRADFTAVLADCQRESD